MEMRSFSENDNSADIWKSIKPEPIDGDELNQNSETFMDDIQNDIKSEMLTENFNNQQVLQFPSNTFIKKMEENHQETLANVDNYPAPGSSMKIEIKNQAVNTDCRLDLLNDSSQSSVLIRKYFLKFKLAFRKTGKSYCCKICNKTRAKKYFQLSALRQHIKYKHFGKRFQCSECAVKYLMPQLLRKHYSMKHGTSGPQILQLNFFKNIRKHSEIKKAIRTQSIEIKYENIIKQLNDGSHYICKLCPRSLPSYNGSIVNIKQHLKEVHCGLRYKCNKCNRKYAELSNLEHHYQSKHNKLASTNRTVISEYEQSSEESTDQYSNQIPNSCSDALQNIKIHSSITKCDNDSMLLKQEIILTDYALIEDCVTYDGLSIESIKDEYATPEITHQSVAATFKNEKHFNGYKRINGFYLCNQCSRNGLEEAFKYKTPAGVQYHINTEHCNNSKKFKNKRLDYKDAVKKLDNKFLCLLCTETNIFNHLNMIHRHIRVEHYGYRYKCTECHKNYRDKHGLLKHYRKNQRHTDMRTEATTSATADELLAQSAQKCKRKYTDMIQRIGDKYICSLCSTPSDTGRMYTHLTAVCRHIRFSHYCMRYKCNDCDLTYPRIPELRRHYTEDHHKKAPARFKKIISDEVLTNVTRSSNEIYEIKHFVHKMDEHYICELCLEHGSMRYKTFSCALTHIQIQHYNYGYICPECKCVQSTSQTILKNHYREKHHKEPPILRLQKLKKTKSN